MPMVAFQSADRDGTRDCLRSAAALPQSSGVTQERMNSLRVAPFSLFVAALSLHCASTAGSTSVMASSLIAPVLGAGLFVSVGERAPCCASTEPGRHARAVRALRAKT